MNYENKQNNRMNNERMTKSKKEKFMWQGKHHYDSGIFPCLTASHLWKKTYIVTRDKWFEDEFGELVDLFTNYVRIIIIILEFLFDWRWNDRASGYCVFYLIWNIHCSGVAYVYDTNRMNKYWIYRCEIVKIFKGTNSNMPLSMNTLNIEHTMTLFALVINLWALADIFRSFFILFFSLFYFSVIPRHKTYTIPAVNKLFTILGMHTKSFKDFHMPKPKCSYFKLQVFFKFLFSFSLFLLMMEI